MFNNMFGQPDDNHCNENNCGGQNNGCFNLCGCNCSWIFLIILFLCCCCGGKNKNINFNVNPCCILLAIALLWCCGGISMRPYHK